MFEPSTRCSKISAAQLPLAAGCFTQGVQSLAPHSSLGSESQGFTPGTLRTEVVWNGFNGRQLGYVRAFNCVLFSRIGMWWWSQVTHISKGVESTNELMAFAALNLTWHGTLRVKRCWEYGSKFQTLRPTHWQVLLTTLCRHPNLMGTPVHRYLNDTIFIIW